MRHPPDKRKPVVATTTGLQKIGIPGSYSETEDSPNRVLLQQAERVRRRFPSLSWPVARVVAELHFGRATV